MFAGSKEIELPLLTALEIADFKQHYPRIVAVDEARKAFRLHEKSLQGRQPTEEEARRGKQLLEAIGQAVLQLPEKATSAPNSEFVGLMEIPVAAVLGHERPDLVPTIQRLSRGELDRPKEEVVAALPEFLAWVGEDRSPLPGPFGSRKRLALWLTDRHHPLTARVMVNRIWQWHFGRGLVSTPNDFGKMGTAPSHPALLDWLADEFIARGWNIKDMHRLLMLSQTYQMASDFGDQHNLETDPHNAYLWRMNRRRLEGEAIWDAIHAVAGSLNTRLGGPPAVPVVSNEELSPLREPWYWTVSADPSESLRRGVYVLQRRNFRFPVLDTFDAPINSSSCPVRDVSTVAPQALWNLNNWMVLEHSKRFAARVRQASGDRTVEWIETAWRLALGRSPSSEETDRAAALLDRFAPDAAAGSASSERVAALERLCLLIFNLNEFLFVD